MAFSSWITIWPDGEPIDTESFVPQKKTGWFASWITLDIEPEKPTVSFFGNIQVPKDTSKLKDLLKKNQEENDIVKWAKEWGSEFVSNLKPEELDKLSERLRTDKIIAQYDAAPDKWKFKQTLSDTELAILNTSRPENKKFWSISEEEIARQRRENTARLTPGILSPLASKDNPKEYAKTFLNAPWTSLTEAEMRIENAKGSISWTIGARVANMFDSITKDTPAKDIVTNQNRSSNLIESSERRIQQEKNIWAYLAKNTDVPEPTTAWGDTWKGEWWKALKQGILRDVPRGFFSSIEMATSNSEAYWPAKSVNEWSAELADRFLADRRLHPEENAPEWSPTFTEWGWHDSKYWARWGGQLLSTVIPAFTSALWVWFATKSPAAALWVWRGFIFTAESGQAYSQLVDSWFSPSESKNWAVIYGMIATALENVNFWKSVNKIMGNAKGEIIKQSFKKAFISSLKEWGKDVLKEAGTEWAQQFSQNVMTKWYDENQDLFEWVVDSVALWGLGWVWFATINTSIDLKNHFRTNPSEARAVVSWEIKATEEQKQVATEELENYESRASEPVMEIHDPETQQPIVKIDTVTYEDGTVASSVTVTSGEDVVTTPFEWEFKTKEEATTWALEVAEGIVWEIVVENPSPGKVEVLEVIKKEKTQKADLSTYTPEEQKVFRGIERLVKNFREWKVEMLDRETWTHPKGFTQAMANILSNVTSTIAHYDFAGWWGEEIGNWWMDKLRELLLSSKMWWFGNSNIVKRNNIIDTLVWIIDGEALPKNTEEKPNIMPESDKDKASLKAETEMVKDTNSDSVNAKIAEQFKTTGILPTEAEIKKMKQEEKVTQAIDSIPKKDNIEDINNQPTNDWPDKVSDTSNVWGETDSGRGNKSDGERTSWDTRPSSNEPWDGLSVGETPSKWVGKKTRAKINEEVKALITSKKFSVKESDYTESEKALLRKYTGAGWKESVWATGRGLLDEYYTPVPIVKAMWDLARKIVPKWTALEPSAGIGRFIENAPDGYSITWMELDKFSGTIAQVLNPSAKITIGDFQSNFSTDNGKKIPITKTYDVVIGNPPYGAREWFYKGLGEENNIGRWDEYFIKRWLDLLNTNGVLVYIIPSSFLNSGISKAKVSITQNSILLDAYRLPEGMFEDTTIGTDIIVLKKRWENESGNTEMFLNGGFFEENPDKILGEIIQRKNRFARMEEAVVWDKSKAIELLKKHIGENLSNKNTEENKTIEPTPETKPSEPSNNIEIFPITEWALAGKVQAIVTEWPEKWRVAIGETESEARKKIKEPISETQVAGRIERPTKSPPKPRAKKEPEKIIDVSGIKTVDSQYINDWYATKEELEIFQAQEPNGIVPSSKIKASWKPYLNYNKGEYYHDINYFSWDVRKKLEELEDDKTKMTDEEYDTQKSGLKSILPDSKDFKDIVFDPLDRFIAEEETETEGRDWKKMTLINTFLGWLSDIPRWAFTAGVEFWDVNRYVRWERARAGTKLIMKGIKEDAKRFFDQFMKTVLDTPTQLKILNRYNKEKNSYVRPDYRSIPMMIKWMASSFKWTPFKLTNTQMDAIGFLVNRWMGLIAHGVWVGKTHSLLVATVVNMQKWWTKRPVFIVPKSTMRMWEATAKMMFPGIKINILEGLQDGVYKKWQKKWDPKTWIEDGSISFISHEGIMKLKFTKEELSELTKDLTDVLEIAGGTEREWEATIGGIETIVGKVAKGAQVPISELWFDHISVDEVHNFRKSFTAAKVEKDDKWEEKKWRFWTVQVWEPAAKAQKLFVISQHIQKNNKGRNVFLASATPFENQPTEVYNILSLMARDRLKEIGLFNMNDFFSSFSNFKSETILGTDGAPKEKEIMLGYKNLPELQALLREFIDRKEDPTIVRPDKIVLTPQLQMSELQKEVKQAILEEYASLWSDWKPKPGADLVAIWQFKSNSLSPYFTKHGWTPKNSTEFVKNSPKINYAMEVLRAVKTDPQTKDRSNFLYIGNEGIDFTGLYVDYLVKNVGYKPEEIAVMTGKTTEDQRTSIMEKFNTWVVKVLIGGTPTKEGINLQDNAYITMNLSLGWNPTEWIQVEWRWWRQGNNLNRILMIYPLVEDSGDILLFQKFLEKSSRINDLFGMEWLTFDVGEIDAEEKRLMLMTDPIAKARIFISMERAKISWKENYLKSELFELERKTKELATLKNDVLRQAWYNEYYQKEKTKMDESWADKSGWSYMNNEEQIKKGTKLFKEQTRKIESIEKQLEKLWVSPETRIAEINGLLEKINTEIVLIEWQFESLVDKYEKENIENRKNTKTVEQLVQDILTENKKLRIRSKEELKAEKDRLVKDLAEKDKAEEKNRIGRFAKKPQKESKQKENKWPDSYEIPEKLSDIDVAKTTEEFKGRIEQLNKLAMWRGIMRRFGKLSKKTSAGQLYKKWVGWVTTLAEVRIRKDIPLDDKTYMAVLAHELGHALEYQMTGATNKNTYEVFGKNLSKEVKATLREELIANTKEMVWVAKYEMNPWYYGMNTELLARFLERHFTEPLVLDKVAPLASEMLLKNAVNSPLLSEYLEAVAGTIDKFQLKFPKFFSFILDQKQSFQAILGERAGNRAYNTIIRRNALQARSKAVFEKELKEKFKDIKNIEWAFQAIEATLKTENDVPVFGTHDFVDVPDESVIDHEDAGWTIVEDEYGNVITTDGKTRMSIDRYTKKEWKMIYDSLSEKEQEFVRDFTAIKDEAKDFINREVIKDVYGIQSDLEGWIHHFWEDSFFWVGKTKLKGKIASARKHRTWQEWYVEDAQKALYKSLTELEGAKIFNDWLNEFVPTVTKPLADWQSPDEGWMEVTGDFVKGFLKKWEVMEYVIKDGKRLKVNRARYQIPIEIYNRFGKIAEYTQEAGMAFATLELIAKAWQINVLAHPGTAVTNAIGWWLQFSLKMFTDVYKSILTGDVSIIGNDIKALIGSLTNWNDVPNWMFGKDSSTYMRDFSSKKYTGKMRILHDKFDNGANVVMAPFQFFESYWKKVIARASGASGLSELTKLTKNWLPPLSENDKAIMEMIEQASDLYGFNYNNVPNWMHEISTNPIGKLVLPFKRYLYKYTKMITRHLFSIANRNMAWEDRLAMFLGLATFLWVIATIINTNDDDKETPEDITTNTPKWMSPKWKVFVWKDENWLEKFIRTIKYPGFNLYAFTKWDIMQGFTDMTEWASSIGPLGQIALHQFGYKNMYEQYKENSQLHAATAASFVPWFRILGDISQILDPFKRKTEDWKQEFTRLIPTTDKEEQERLHGKIYVDQVPIGKNSTKDVERKNFSEDTLKSLFTGIYTTRIDPSAVKAYEDRFATNEEKSKGKESWDIRKKEVIDKYVKLYQESNDFRKWAYMERNMQIELFGKWKLSKSEIWLFTSVKEDFRLARSTDPFVRELADLNTNDERKLKIKALQDSMDMAEWKKYVWKLVKEWNISLPLYKSLFTK